ncbi:hypothetical protein BH11ARM2_BH11ARM2_29710 [soil metagenome]
MDEAQRQSIADRATRIYEERIRPLVEKDHFGKVVSIEANTGDYEIAADNADEVPALRRLRARHSDPKVFAVRVGYRTVGKIGGGRWRLAEGEKL